MARQTLEQFIRSQLTDATREDGDRCVAFAVQHYQGAQANELKTIKIGSKPLDPKDIADSLQQAADNYTDIADAGSGVQQFEVVSFYELTKDEPQGRYLFKMDSTPVAKVTGLGTEAPTALGVAQQDMRHREGWMRFVLEGNAQVHQAYQSIIRTQASEIQNMKREQFDTLELAREMILEKAADMHKHSMEEMAFSRATKEREHIMNILPTAANSLLGKKIFPENAADTGLFEALATDLSVDDLRMLMTMMSSKLKPHVMGLLADRLEKIIQTKMESEALVKQANGETNGTH